MKIRKRIIGILLSLALVLGIVPGVSLTVYADGEYTIHNEIPSSLATVTCSSNAAQGTNVSLTVNTSGKKTLTNDREIKLDGIVVSKANGEAVDVNWTTSTSSEYTGSFIMPAEEVYITFPFLTDVTVFDISANTAVFRTKKISTTDTYTFETTDALADIEQKDPYGYLYYKGSTEASDYTGMSNDDGGVGYNFKIDQSLSSGTFCHIGVGHYSDSSSGPIELYSGFLPSVTPATLNLTYGNSSASRTITVTPNMPEGYAATYQWYESRSNSTSYGSEITGATDATYTIPLDKQAGQTLYYYCKVQGTKGGVKLRTFSNIASVTIAKANSVAATVTTNNRTYDGSEKPLVTVTGEATGGTMKYSIGTDATTVPTSGWDASIPNATDSGTYYVWYKAEGDSNHSDTVPVSVTTNISKKDITVTALDQTIKEGSNIREGTDYISGNGLENGHTFSKVTLNADNSKKTITPSEVGINDADGKDVTNNYEITYKDGTLTCLAAIKNTVTFKAVNGSWNDGTTENKIVTFTGFEGDTLKLTADQIPAVGTKPADAYEEGSWDVTPVAGTAITADTTYTYTYAAKNTISFDVTFKVVNGSWNDGTTEDKIVTLTGYEGDTLKLTADQIPAVGTKPADAYEEGSWDVTPVAGTAITADTTYTYTYAAKNTISFDVTFKVVNGSWNDGTTEDKIVTLTGYEGDTLKLTADQIPEVGTKPADSYREGSWDVTSVADTVITDDVTYTYTYAAEEKKETPSIYKSEWVNGQWYDENGNTDYEYKGSWKEDEIGKWYGDTIGWYARNRWMKIDGYWYFFDESGYMATNCYCRWWDASNYWWVGEDGKWDGSDPAIWHMSGTKWWFGTLDGTWFKANGWLKINGAWYYFDSNGILLTNQYIGEYWVNGDGAWVP